MASTAKHITTIGKSSFWVIPPLNFPVAAAAAVTQDADTLAATGSILVAATAAITQGADTLSAAGGVLVLATAAITQGADTLVAAGGVLVSATMAVTQAADTQAAAGRVLVGGTAAVTQMSDTLFAFTDPPIAFCLKGGIPGFGPLGTRALAQFPCTSQAVLAAATADWLVRARRRGLRQSAGR